MKRFAISVLFSLFVFCPAVYCVPLERPNLDGQLNPGEDVAVEIISPKMDEVLEKGPVTVNFEVSNFDMKANGPHLHCVLDNRYYLEHVDPKTAIRINSISPGTHVLAVFAVASWHESWKNKEASAVVKFHVGKETAENDANMKGPFLILNMPMGHVQKWADKWVLFDFLIFNATIADDDTRIQDYRVHYSLDGDDASVEYLESRFWLDMKPGPHRIEIGLTDRHDRPVSNGNWTSTSRQFYV